MQHLKDQKLLHRKFVYQILIALRRQLAALPSLVDVPIPEGTHINVCGDTHGQYYDLLNIFETFGMLVCISVLEIAFGQRRIRVPHRLSIREQSLPLQWRFCRPWFLFTRGRAPPLHLQSAAARCTT